MIRYLIKHRFSTSPYDILSQRHQVYQHTSQILKDPAFVDKMKQIYNSPSVYCGYDPTAESLHLGNLLSIIALGRLSTIGLRPIFVVGGATARIGDPSGKKKQRPALQPQIITRNILGITQDITRVYDNILKRIQKQNLLKTKQYQIIDNTHFYDSFDILDFLNDVGRYFRLNVLLSKQNVSSRLNTEQGLAYSEFSYTLLQSHDYYKLHRSSQCVLQIGGSDQWGNITNGCDYIKKKLKKEVYGLTLPLLTTGNGMKFGKTENNALFINPEITPKSDVYNYFFNTSDADVEGLLKVFTFVPVEEIEAVMIKHRQEPHKRIAQKLLCQQIFTILYNQQVSEHSQQRLLRMRKQQIKQLQLSQLQSLLQSIPISHLKRSQIQAIRDLPQLFVYLNIKQSKTEGRKDIEHGGAYINNGRIKIDIIQRPLLEIIETELLHGQYILFRFGKKSLYAVKYQINE